MGRLLSSAWATADEGFSNKDDDDDDDNNDDSDGDGDCDDDGDMVFDRFTRWLFFVK